MRKNLLFIFVGFSISLGSYLLISNNGYKKYNIIKSQINKNRTTLKKYLLPYKLISQQEETITQQKEIISQREKTIAKEKQRLSPFVSLELAKKKRGDSIKIKESFTQTSNNKTIKKYKLIDGFYAGIYRDLLYPGSGFIDFHKNNIFILSSRGILAYRRELTDDKNDFKQIKNNINSFIGREQFKKNKWFSIKDILIANDKVFVSYTEEIKSNCWGTSVIYGNLNYQNIEFKRLFSPISCVHAVFNIDETFNAHQSGGRIISLDDENILLTIGDYRSRHLSQNLNSVFGKIIKINIKTSQYKIVTAGNRNAQGLYFDEENNFLIQTEHGPFGGDEINLIDIEKIYKHKIQNYGWPISSGGEHYPSVVEYNPNIYKKYPLHKSHINYGFIEPIKSFTPSIGISEVAKIGKNKYVVSSLKDKSLYFITLNSKNELQKIIREEVFERIRDLKYNNKKLYMFMEDTASIGVINLNN